MPRSEKSRPEAIPRPHTRPEWREQLVECERGVRAGFRGDSALFMHGFVDCIVLAAGAVLGLSAIGWCALILALGGVMTAELFRQAIRALALDLAEHSPSAGRTAPAIAAAATLLAACCGLAIVAIVFTQRIMQLI